MRNASDRLFKFSALKVSERTRVLLVSPAKKTTQVTSFCCEFLVSLTRLLSGACVVANSESLSKQTNNGKIPIRDRKEYKQQAIKFDLKKVQGHVSCGLDDFRPSRSAYRDAVFTGFTSKLLLRSQIL